jgi:predicted amidohydrolase
MAQIQPGHVLIKGARLMDPGKRRAEATDVLVTDGVIAAIGVGLAAPEGAQVVDAEGMIIHPGLINAHTHGHGGLARGQGSQEDAGECGGMCSAGSGCRIWAVRVSVLGFGQCGIRL